MAFRQRHAQYAPLGGDTFTDPYEPNKITELFAMPYTFARGIQCSLYVIHHVSSLFHY